MDNLNDLKAIWLTAKTDNLPNAEAMVQHIKKYRRQKLIKIIMLVLTAAILVGVMAEVMHVYRSTMLSTRIGEIFILIAGLILVITNINSLIRFYGLKDCSNRDFIKFLEHTRKRQLFYYTKTQVAALAFCSAGLLLYIFEMVHTNTLFWVISYPLLLAYLLVMWLVIRPLAFKKQERKMLEKINRIKHILKQTADED